MFAQESVMEIQKEREAFERFKAKQIGIDYETLKKDLDDCEKRFPNNRYAGWNFKSDWELWQAATAQAVPKWISVKDNLPPANILVLGMSQTRSNIFNIYNVMALDEFEEVDVTHWMPLPDAPQEPTND